MNIKILLDLGFGFINGVIEEMRNLILQDLIQKKQLMLFLDNMMENRLLKLKK